MTPLNRKSLVHHIQLSFVIKLEQFIDIMWSFLIKSLAVVGHEMIITNSALPAIAKYRTTYSLIVNKEKYACFLKRVAVLPNGSV